MKCNRDCFNCVFEDCILDDVEALTAETTESQRKYHKTKYQLNREKYIQRTIEWNKNNPERYKANQKKAVKRYYEKNREKRLAYFREYYRKKKEEKLVKNNSSVDDGVVTKCT